MKYFARTHARALTPSPRARGQNFGCTIAESQFIARLTDARGAPTAFARNLDALNLAFTLLFTAELAVNAFSNWCRLADIYIYIYIYIHIKRERERERERMMVLMLIIIIYF